MRMRNVALTFIAYVVLTFGCAFVWHLVLFRGFYDRIGYFGSEEPVIALGLLAILIQAFVIALVYPLFERGDHPLAEAARVSATFGVTIVSVQVLAAAAKHHAPASLEWFLFEGLYFLVQFALLALAFALIHRTPGNRRQAV